MTAGFWRLLLSTVWQRQWWLLTAAIVVIVNGGNDGIDLTALMAASSTVAVVDGGGNDGIFTTRYYINDCHPHPHHPRSLPSTMTAINKDHHCCSCHQLPLLSMMTAFAIVDDKQ